MCGECNACHGIQTTTWTYQVEKALKNYLDSFASRSQRNYASSYIRHLEMKREMNEDDSHFLYPISGKVRRNIREHIEQIIKSEEANANN